MLITIKFMRVVLSKFSRRKKEKKFKQGAAHPVRRHWIRLWSDLLNAQKKYQNVYTRNLQTMHQKTSELYFKTFAVFKLKTTQKCNLYIVYYNTLHVYDCFDERRES